MTLLVVGKKQVNSGKTTFTLGLVERISGVGFKPRASNSYWYHYDQFLRSVQKGSLYGKDASFLSKVSSDISNPEEINNLHRLWRPSPQKNSGILGRQGSEFVLDRLGDKYIVNNNIKLPDLLKDNLSLEDCIYIESFDDFNELMENEYIDEMENFREKVKCFEDSIVESYKDIALPLQGIGFSRVAVVEPMQVEIYEGSKYIKACKICMGSNREGILEPVVEDVVDYLSPLATVRLPILTSEEKQDPKKIKSKYNGIYDRLLK